MLTGAGGAPLLSEFVSLLAVRFGAPGVVGVVLVSSESQPHEDWTVVAVASSYSPGSGAPPSDGEAPPRHGATEQQANVA